MNQLLKKIKAIPKGVKSAVVYIASSVVTRGLAIITVPIFTRLMTTDQIGTVNLYNSWYSLISAFATLSLTSGGFAVAMKEYANKRDEYVSSVLTLTSIIAILIAIIYAVEPTLWQKVLGLPNVLIVLMLIGFLVAPARDFWLARQRYEYKYKLAGTVSILTAIIASVVSVFAVLYSEKKAVTDVAVWRLIANYSVIYGVAAVIWIYIILKGRKLYSKEYWKISLAISIPLVGYNIAGQILNVSDRMMIKNMVNNSAVGIYSTLYTVSSLSLMVWQAINAAFVPYLFQNIDKEKHDIKRISNLLMGMYAILALILTYFAPEVVKILATEEYYEAIYIMPPIAAGVFFTSFANLYSNIAIYYRKTKYVVYPTVIAACVNLILNYIFIKIYGYMAAAYTTLISYIVLAILQVMWSNEICKGNGKSINNIYDNKKLLLLAIVTTVASLMGILLYSHTLARYAVLIICAGVALMAAKRVYRSGIMKKR